MKDTERLNQLEKLIKTHVVRIGTINGGAGGIAVQYGNRHESAPTLRQALDAVMLKSASPGRNGELARDAGQD